MELMLLGRNDEENRRYVLRDGETLIGRRPGCDIVLDAPAVAARHARVFSVDNRAVVYGIGPEWPVYVNGVPVDRRPLVDGDEVELAHYRLRFVSDETLDATTAPEAEIEQPLFFPMPEAVQPAVPSPTPMPETVQSTAPSPTPIPEPVQSATPSPDPSPETAQSTDASTETERPDSSDEYDPDEQTELAETGIDEEDQAPDSPIYHLDILTGINQGRRITLNRNHVVLGFDKQRLVEIKTHHDGLEVRTLAESVDALLNEEQIDESFTEASPGDVLWVQRISMRINKEN